LELGIADNLITSLGHIQELTVRPLSAVRKFHDPARDPLAAGRELGVEAVLDGHIHRADDQIRVTARLIRTTDGKLIWGAKYDEQLTSIFGKQALDLDPDFALAKVGLADTLSRIPMPTDGPSDEIPRAGTGIGGARDRR
jgi:hypothetical protein